MNTTLSPPASSVAAVMARADQRRDCTADRDALSAGYDIAQTNEENYRHWRNADGFSADAAHSPQVRKTGRERARYEFQNNSYARGIVLTLANDTVGTGPSPQLLTDYPEINRQIEARFWEWADAIGLPEKLRTLKIAKTVDGESFANFATNRNLPTPVKLDLAESECDQWATPFLSPLDPQAVDGIEFDSLGRPKTYHRLRHHPGSHYFGALDKEDVPAAQVMHLFRCERPGQHRGFTELAPALPLFAQLRRYTLATIAAAETAADFAAVMYTDSPHVEPTPTDPMAAIKLYRRSMTALPRGWKLGQIEAEQPTTTYGQFKAEILSEIARCLNTPFNVAAGDSSKYNYASGRLDHQTYGKSIDVERSYFERFLLDRILLEWLREAALIPGFLPPEIGRLARLGLLPPHQWFWDGREHVDPLKEAKAQETRLANHTTTLAREYARQGLDWEEQLRQRGREAALMQELGLPAGVPAARPDEREDEEEEAGHAQNKA